METRSKINQKQRQKILQKKEEARLKNMTDIKNEKRHKKRGVNGRGEGLIGGRFNEIHNHENNNTSPIYLYNTKDV